VSRRQGQLGGRQVLIEPLRDHVAEMSSVACDEKLKALKLKIAACLFPRAPFAGASWPIGPDTSA
jgi:hypothetical protein